MICPQNDPRGGWVIYDDSARGAAENRLQTTLAQLREVGIDADGEIMDPDPYAAFIVPARSARLRHLRKYAEGNLGPRSFFFRGPMATMNLRAQNLTAFCDLASGVDDDTWLFHLGRGDYSTWLTETIKDDDLAREVAGVEQAAELAPSDSRRLIRDAIDRRYMLPG